MNKLAISLYAELQSAVLMVCFCYVWRVRYVCVYLEDGALHV